MVAGKAGLGELLETGETPTGSGFAPEFDAGVLPDVAEGPAGGAETPAGEGDPPTGAGEANPGIRGAPAGIGEALAGIGEALGAGEGRPVPVGEVSTGVGDARADPGLTPLAEKGGDSSPPLVNDVPAVDGAAPAVAVTGEAATAVFGDADTALVLDGDEVLLAPGAGLARDAGLGEAASGAAVPTFGITAGEAGTEPELAAGCVPPVDHINIMRQVDDRWLLETEGTNLRGAMAVPGVDFTRTTTSCNSCSKAMHTRQHCNGCAQQIHLHKI